MAAVARSMEIQKTLQFMERNFDAPITLDQLAGIANLSRPRFMSRFRREVGMPPYRYLSQLRIGVAQTLLHAGMPLARVAAEVGFFDQPHLYRHFKRICGVTPRQYLASSRQLPDFRHAG